MAECGAVSPAGSVGASAFGRGVHQTSANVINLTKYKRVNYACVISCRPVAQGGFKSRSGILCFLSENVSPVGIEFRIGAEIWIDV